MGEHIKITAAQRAYLASFDRWLHEVWVPGIEGEGHEAERDKSLALWNLLGEKGVRYGPLETPPAPGVRRRNDHELSPVPTAECERCGRTFGRRPGQGRPRKFCETCAPVRRRVIL